MKNLLAQINFAPKGGFRGFGPLGLEGKDASSAVGIFSTFISGVIGILTIIAVIWSVFSIITGAISIISSGGDKQALESARKKITMGIIGLVVVLISLLLIEIVGYFLGLPNILNIQYLFNLINP